LAADFEAGHRRQNPVQEDKIGRVLGDAGQLLPAVGRLLDAKPLPFEIVPEHGG